MLQRDPVDARSVRCRDDAISFQQFAKSLGACSKRQYCSSVFLEIELCKHLAAVRLRTNSKDKFVAPPPGLAASLDDVG